MDTATLGIVDEALRALRILADSGTDLRAREDVCRAMVEALYTLRGRHAEPMRRSVDMRLDEARTLWNEAYSDLYGSVESPRV